MESRKGVGSGLIREAHQRKQGGLVLHQKGPRSLGCRESSSQSTRRVAGGEKVVGSMDLHSEFLREFQIRRMGMKIMG